MGDAESEVRVREDEEAITGNIRRDMIGYKLGDLDLEIMGCEGAWPIDEAIVRACEEIGSTFAVTSSNGCPDYLDHKHFWDVASPRS